MSDQMTKQDAIERIEIFRRGGYLLEGSSICKAIDIAIDALKNPTIDHVQRHAYWEPNDVGEYHCTYCGVECDVDEFHKALLNPFCGNCGSYMIGGE